jgi:hypothetical protein
MWEIAALSLEKLDLVEESGERAYERSQTLREVFVVGQLVQRPWSVLVYEQRHGVTLWWERKGR